MSTSTEDPLYSRSTRHRLDSLPSNVPVQNEFCLIEVEDIPFVKMEYNWFLHNEFPIALQEIGQLLNGCLTQLHLVPTSVDSRALLIPEQSADYVTGTLHIDGESVSRADLMIRPSPKYSNKNKVYAGLKGFSNSWKLNQLTDLSNELNDLLQKYAHLIHRQDIHYLFPHHLSFVLTDIIDSLHKCQYIFDLPKRPNLREIHLRQNVFKPTLPDEILLNIFFSSFHLIVTVFYLSNSPTRYQLSNAKPIVSLSQQESYINMVLEGSGGKEFEVVFQGEGSCQVPPIKHLLTTITTILNLCQTLKNNIECFTNM